MSSRFQDLSLKILYEEYRSLKTEIHGRSRDQLVCITSSLLGISALFGAIASNPDQLRPLFLLAPWVLLVFGIIWCDHHTTIHLIGSYIKHLELHRIPEILGHNLSEDASTKKLFESSPEMLLNTGWEAWFSGERKRHRKSWKRNLVGLIGSIHRFLPLFYFLLPSVLSIASYFSSERCGSVNISPWLELSLVLFDSGLIIIFILFWYRACLATDF